jgi:hypothetical protein
MNVLEEELAEGGGHCVREEVGLEVTAFAFPANLDHGFRRRARGRERSTRLAGHGRVAEHGSVRFPAPDVRLLWLRES